MVPLTVAFQLFVNFEPSLKVQFTVQPLMGVVLLLVMRMAAVKPVLHSLDTTNKHFAPEATEFADEDAKLLRELDLLELLVAIELLDLLELSGDDELAALDLARLLLLLKLELA